MPPRHSENMQTGVPKVKSFFQQINLSCSRDNRDNTQSSNSLPYILAESSNKARTGWSKHKVGPTVSQPGTWQEVHVGHSQVGWAEKRIVNQLTLQSYEHTLNM